MLLFLIIFAVLFCVVLLCVGLGNAFQRSQQNKQMRAMLRTADPAGAERQIDLISSRGSDDQFTKLLESLKFVASLDLALNQAGLEWSAPKLIWAAFASMIIAALLVSRAPLPHFRPLIAAVACALAAIVPFAVVFRKRAKRISKFEEQFPEALDFMARSMRAGHGFAVGLELLVTDSPEPLSSSFQRVLRDVQLGSPLDVALGRLVTLVPSLDVRFFTASVLLQQETGGNLSEILTKLAHIIRERFGLKGQVKAASAHGRITGLVLLIMPIAVAAVMMVIAPSYLAVLIAEPKGRQMILGAVCAQIAGYFIIQKIVNIKV